MAGTIEKRGNNTWRYGIQVLVGDKYEWIRNTVKMPASHSEARQRREVKVLLAKLITAIDEGRIKPIRRTHTVKTFSDLWLQEYVIPELSPAVQKTYKNFLATRILPELGEIPLRKLTPLLLTKFINTLRTSPRRSTRKADEELKHQRSPSDIAKMSKDPGKTISLRTVCHYHDCLDAMLDKAVQWDIIAVNPMIKVDRPRAPKAKAEYLTEERAVELLRCLSKSPNMSFRAAVLLAVFCGLRLGEVSELRLSDVDWDKGTIDISRALKYTPEMGSYAGTPKSEAGNRLIALPPGLMDVLRESRQYQQDTAALIGDLWEGEGWIVHNWNGARYAYGTVSKQFRKFAEVNGFPGVSFHALRHTHATILLANNIDAVAVASRLGHGDASVTLKTYAHALRRRDEDAALVAQELFDHADISFTRQETKINQLPIIPPPPDPPPVDITNSSIPSDILQNLPPPPDPPNQ
ncbi:site-specific integrase [Eubacteriales bacterium OttesenSCG-928-N13]|nr:site-specific integrase [Eubacteriales bacterium OttesenSCG-928-N13]